MISGKFFMVAFCSLILYTLFINLGYVNFMDAKLYKVYLYDPEGTQLEVSSLIHPVFSLEELNAALASDTNGAVSYTHLDVYKRQVQSKLIQRQTGYSIPA